MPTGSQTIQFIADRGDARLRLDLILLRRLFAISGLSRTRAQDWIKAGAVTVDGHPVLRPSARVPEGAAVAFALSESVRCRAVPRPEPLDLKLVYEDEWLLAINKPPGLVVHPSHMNQSGTLLNGVLWRLQDRPATRIGLVNRIDKGTSGLVLVALTSQVHARIQREAAAGRVKKEYLAVVRGTPRPRRGSIELPLARDPRDRRRVIVATNGARSVTRYEVISEGGPACPAEAEQRREGPPVHPYSLVRCELVTGRTHQIRVHLAARGWPVLDDPLYGVPLDESGETSSRGLRHQALHAWRMTLQHPVTREILKLEAPLPSDWRHLPSPTS